MSMLGDEDGDVGLLTLKPCDSEERTREQRMEQPVPSPAPGIYTLLLYSYTLLRDYVLWPSLARLDCPVAEEFKAP